MAATVLTTDNFEEEVLKSEVPVLVDFWATWCGPCKMVGPIIEEIEHEANGFKVYSVDVDNEPDLASRFGIMSIPTLIVFKNGQVYKQSLGFQPKEQILELLK